MNACESPPLGQLQVHLEC